MLVRIFKLIFLATLSFQSSSLFAGMTTNQKVDLNSSAGCMSCHQGAVENIVADPLFKKKNKDAKHKKHVVK